MDFGRDASLVHSYVIRESRIPDWQAKSVREKNRYPICTVPARACVRGAVLARVAARVGPGTFFHGCGARPAVYFAAAD
jgi:hypothetical protein